MLGEAYKCTLVWWEDLKERGYLEEIGAEGSKI